LHIVVIRDNSLALALLSHPLLIATTSTAIGLFQNVP